jgi:hemerythrin
MDSFSVGHAELDAEHRQLIQVINEIEAAVRGKEDPERIAELLSSLRKAAVAHFRKENAILAQIKAGTYEPLKGRAQTPNFLRAMAEAAFDEHIAEHDRILVELDAIFRCAFDELAVALKTWFLHHAIKQDSHLKAIFQAM